MLKRALGYTYKEITREAQFNPQTEQYEMVVTKEITKEVVPDTTAQIFWLKNRKPDEWRDKKDVEHSGSVNNPFAALSTEQLLKLAGMMNDGTTAY